MSLCEVSLPTLVCFPPTRRQGNNRGGRVAHYLGHRDGSDMTVVLSLPLHPAPDVEVTRHILAGSIFGRQLGHLYKPRLDGFKQAEVRNDPGKGLSDLV